MKVSLKDKDFTTSKIYNEQDINSEEQEKKEEITDKSVNLNLSVKSEYILKKILLILGEKRKLLLLKYNNYYQKLLGINIENYQKLSGKIIIGGINGYGKEKEFNDLKLIFKGYYINGKRNGKGKEYNKEGKLIFEGEYKNGIKNGKGIEYNGEDILFVGEYLNGKKWNGIVKEYQYQNYSYFKKFYGQYSEGVKIGREYDIDGEVIFEGKYSEDKRWEGIIYNKKGILFPIKNGNGKVKEYDEEGKLIFEGEYINGEKKGKEYDEDDNLVFEGEYCKEKRWNGKIKEYKKPSLPSLFTCGHGKRDLKYEIREKNIQEKLKKYKNILKYEGEYLYGKRKGIGKENDINGKLLFEGNYLNANIKKKKPKDKYNEYISRCKNPDYYKIPILVLEGNLKSGLKDGLIKEYDYGKLIFEGEYKNGKKWNGKGKEFDDKRNLIFEGEYKNGNKKGKEYNSNKQLIFEGEYLDDERWNGKGKEFDDKRNLVFEGEYLNGKIWEGIIYNKKENLEFPIKNGNGKVKEYIVNKCDKTIFEGEYINGVLNGKIKLYDYKKDLLILEREYLNGENSGTVKQFNEYTGNLEFKGEYLDSQRLKGKEYNYGEIIFEGIYFKGKRWN